jgi:lipid-binding SYLF domain-containing protein
MVRIRPAMPIVILALCLSLPHSVWAEFPGGGDEPLSEIGKVEDAVRVLDEMMREADKSIPRELLENCAGIAIIPDVIRAAYVIGGRYGKGVLVLRRGGRWSDPVFISLTSGSVGWQIGVESADVILVFRTARGIDDITRGKFTLGGDVGIAVGPVGRNAQAGTDVGLKAEIYSYSRSRGLYAGLSLQGASLRVSDTADRNFYRIRDIAPQAIFDGRVSDVPSAAAKLRETLEKYAAPGRRP